MQELRCRGCGNAVLVEKYSPTHTSVQWLTDAESSCPQFARRAVTGERSQWIPSCPALRETIAQAVASGELPTDSDRTDPDPLIRAGRR